MLTKPQGMVKQELIGLHIEVIDANNKTLIGQHGMVIDETKNTIIIKNKAGIKKILKNGARFRLETAGKTAEIEGKPLTGRPEERIKK